VTKQYDFLHYSLFVTFFPHLIAGPIVFYRNLMPQFARPETYRFQPQNFAGGLTLAVVGLAKKVVIADQLAPVAGHVFGGTQGGGAVGMVAAWVGVLAFTLQLYFDFSGYSDMAVGFARMFNTTFPTNFDSPYKARDIVDFWRRWHITLSNFLRDHIYIPLGGNRHGAFARYRNLFVTMLLGGLWHGAGWTFVIWGGLHGLYLVVNHAWLHFANGRAWTALWPLRGLGWLVTLVAVMVGWVFFRAASVADAMNLLARMAGTGGLGAKGLEITAQQGAVLLMAALIAVLAPNTNAIFRLGEPLKGNGAEQPAPLWRLSPVTAVATALLFVVVVLHLSQISTFLYFQF
jgi:D-alanyl-lipoteichoic acid acyltransferase DltB (MBOAT superfamily)